MSASTTKPVLHVSPTSRSNLAMGGTSLQTALHAVEELPRELVGAALKDAADLGYERLVVEGGEPFLYDGLPGLLSRARRLEFVTTLVTNGTLLGQARRWSPVAPLIDHLVLALHGIGTTHDAFSRRDGAFAQAITNLEAVRERRVSLGFQLTLTKVNATELDDVVRLAAEHGATSLQIVRPAGLTRADAELSEIVHGAQRLGSELGVAVQSDVVAQDQLMLFRGQFVPRFPARELVGLAPELFIEACGRVTPLTPEVPGRLMLGSLHRQRLATLASAWLGSCRAAELASVCDAAWWQLAGHGQGAGSIRWAEEVAERLHAAEAPAPLLVAA